MYLDSNEPLAVTVSNFNTPTIEVQGGGINSNQHLSIQYIGNIAKVTSATGTVYYTLEVYLNGSNTPILTSGVYKDTMPSGKINSIVNLADYYMHFEDVDVINSFAVKLNVYYSGGKVQLSNQRLHVEILD